MNLKSTVLRNEGSHKRKRTILHYIKIKIRHNQAVNIFKNARINSITYRKTKGIINTTNDAAYLWGQGRRYNKKSGPQTASKL